MLQCFSYLGGNILKLGGLIKLRNNYTMEGGRL